MKKPKFDTTVLKQQVEDNPLVAAGLGVAILNGIAKLGKVRIDSRNSKTWSREVKRRERSSKK